MYKGYQTSWKVETGKSRQFASVLLKFTYSKSLLFFPFQLNRLKEYEKDYDTLAEAEQFAISISGIKRLVPRLKSLMFKQRYKELVQVNIMIKFNLNSQAS